MQTELPFYECPEEALKAAVAALGGAKIVGAKVFPDGTGMPSTWLCMGCGHKRQPLGSRGVGVFKRCSFCVAAKASGTAVPAALGADSRGGVCAGEH